MSSFSVLPISLPASLRRRLRPLLLLGAVVLCLPVVAGSEEGATPVVDRPERGPLPLETGWRFLEDPRPDQPPDPRDPRWQEVPGTYGEQGSRPPGRWAGGWFENVLDVKEEALGESLALRLKHPGASEVFLDGRRLARFGRLADGAAGGERPFDPRGVPIVLGLEGPGIYRLTIRYTCVDAARPWIGPWLTYRQGAGFEASIDLTSEAIRDVSESRAKILVLNLGLGGLALGFAVLHGLIFAFHRRHRGNLWFALFALGIGVNGGCEALLKAWGHFGLWGLALIRLVNLLAAGTLLCALLLFLAQLRPEPTYRAARALAVAFLGFVGISFVPPLAPIFSPAYLVWISLFAVAVIAAGVSAWRARPPGWRSLGLSAVGVVWVVGAEILKHRGKLGLTAEVLVYGFGVALILSGASLFLARRIAREGRELEVLARDLEARVEERTRELELSERQAQEASRAKSAFLATMSHEIRTPMNAVVGLAELLGKADVPEREREMAGTLRRSAVSLLRLIDEILDLSRIESGHLTLEAGPVRIDQVLDDVVELFASRAEQAGVELGATVQPDPVPWIVGDRDRFYQILINLVGNALKFTHEGSVSLSAILAPGKNAEHLHLRLEVADTGIGIAEEDQASLFEPFYQIDSSSTRHFGGAGLGLAICKQLADLMEADLRVESRPGEGTRFLLDLEVASTVGPDSESAAPEASADGNASLPLLKILLAEDNPVNQWVVRLLLEELGQEAQVEESGPAALEAASAESFDVIVLDLHMPGMDGVEVARRLRERQTEKRPYLIAFTASVMEEDRRRCEAAGMDDFLAKPADLERLREALERAVGALG